MASCAPAESTGTCSASASHDLDVDRIRVLLRDIFTAAGGDHDDWGTYDQTMRDQVRTAVLITPTRIRGNS